MILGLKDAHGQWKEEPPDVKRIISDYFSQLFQSSTHDEGLMDEALANLTPCVSPTTSQQLSLPYNSSKVLLAPFYMSPLKSPGPDGFSVLFFKKYWRILGSDMISCAEIS